MVQRGGPELDQHLALAGDRIGRVLVAQHLGPAVLVDPDRLHGHNPRMTAAELARLGEELGLDAIGAAPAEPYAGTEEHIRERRARGLFADMRFTMARPEVSCHPESLLPGARTVVSAALCYWAPEPPLGRGRGGCRATRGATPTPCCGRGSRSSDERLGGSYRVLVDENDHVDREAAARAGVGFYGKNTMLITRRHGSWVVLGTLVTDVELEPSPPLALDCGSCTLCIEACPTGALDEPGVLDANKCLSYCDAVAGADPRGVPGRARRDGVRLRHLPGRLPVEPRGREAARGRAAAAPAPSRTSRSSTGSRPTRPSSAPAIRVSTCRATTAATSSETRSSRSATWAATTRC